MILCNYLVLFVISTRAGVSKLYPWDKIQPTSYLCNYFTGTQIHAFVSTFYLAAFMLHRQALVVWWETLWPTKTISLPWIYYLLAGPELLSVGTIQVWGRIICHRGVVLCFVGCAATGSAPTHYMQVHDTCYMHSYPLTSLPLDSPPSIPSLQF